jgi:hypothetical protein
MPKSLALLQFVNGVTYEEEEVLLLAKPNLFAIGTITLPKPKILMLVATDAKISTNAKTGTNAKIGTNMKIGTDELIFDFPHTSNKFLVDITLAWIKVQDMKMAKWNLLE